MTIDLSTLFQLPSGINEDMALSLFSAVKEKSEGGMDYIKFKQSVKNLKDMNMDDATSLKSAYATASTLGITKEELLKSINGYKAVIDHKRDEFILAMQKSITERISEPEESINEMKSQIEKINKEIELMKEKQQQYQDLITKTSSEIEEAKAKIDQRKLEFVQVYESFSGILSSDEEQIGRLL
jgi:chromosome segregation ATPase